MSGLPKHGLYLACDYGEKYIGIASGHTNTSIASPLAVVKNASGTPDWQHLQKLVAEWQPIGFVVGIPVHMDGSEQAITHHARGFCKRLRKQLLLPVYTVDERLTTQHAETIIRENRQRSNRRKTNKADRDKIAAALILEKWFESNHDYD